MLLQELLLLLNRFQKQSKFISHSSRENDNKKRKKFMRDNFDEDEKEQLKKYEKKGMIDNLDLEEENKEYSKKENNKGKKAKRDNLDDSEK